MTGSRFAVGGLFFAVIIAYVFHVLTDCSRTRCDGLLWSWMSSFMTSLGLQQLAYVIVFDAGSTGTRLLGYKFTSHPTWMQKLFGLQPNLVDELWLQDKPGLSSFALNPSGAAASVQRLLDESSNFVRHDVRQDTSIILRATAGLRLLAEKEADAILNAVKDVLINSGYRVPSAMPLIEIMNPMKEGLFGWFSINYLLKRSNDDVTALDLGGGSTQIVFKPTALPVRGLDDRPHFLHHTVIRSDSMSIYSHSYLGLGLMAARLQMLQLGNTSRSVCYPSHTHGEWSFGGQFHAIERHDDASYATCRALFDEVIGANEMHTPTEIVGRPLAGFSYFYDKAVEASLISKESGRGTVTILEYEQAAEMTCNSSGSDVDPFLCMDLTYIVSLLHTGYELPLETEMSVYKKIDGYEVTWAMGLAYTLI